MVLRDWQFLGLQLFAGLIKKKQRTWDWFSNEDISVSS
ncbi:hypothetical protein DBT_0728 [Dissulfuribacter thermophilus]|uniref:Uncharacterized protein n=1 Tax=Dissulfuribacter thermophilus TaxID=1156395 RepID=A0A1B9F7D7_9BACT|nr:hypothetical protein DBT_0728 [Dissulfuribacter thermophilus]